MLEPSYVLTAFCPVCVFAMISFFWLHIACLSFLWNQNIPQRISRAVMVWWTQKWSEQILSRVILDWKMDVRWQSLLWSALFYSCCPEAFFFPHCHRLFRFLFSVSQPAFPLGSGSVEAAVVLCHLCGQGKFLWLFWTSFLVCKMGVTPSHVKYCVGIGDSLCNNITPLRGGSDTGRKQKHSCG